MNCVPSQSLICKLHFSKIIDRTTVSPFSPKLPPTTKGYFCPIFEDNFPLWSHFLCADLGTQIEDHSGRECQSPKQGRKIGGEQLCVLDVLTLSNRGFAKENAEVLFMFVFYGGGSWPSGLFHKATQSLRAGPHFFEDGTFRATRNTELLPKASLRAGFVPARR